MDPLMRRLDMKKLTFLDKDALPEVDWKKLELLHAAVGWKRPIHKANRIRQAFSNSYSFIVAHYNDELIGCGRSISDGQVHGWIHDLVVAPNFQRLGVGTMILQKLVDQLAGVRYLGLLTASESIPFYEKSGFQTGWSAMTLRQKMR